MMWYMNWNCCQMIVLYAKSMSTCKIPMACPEWINSMTVFLPDCPNISNDGLRWWEDISYPIKFRNRTVESKHLPKDTEKHIKQALFSLGQLFAKSWVNTPIVVHSQINFEYIFSNVKTSCQRCWGWALRCLLVKHIVMLCNEKILSVLYSPMWGLHLTVYAVSLKIANITSFDFSFASF